MGIWDWLRRPERRDNKGTTAADLLKLRVTNSDAGVSVDQTTAMQISAVNACVRVIAEDVAGLPFCVYQRNESGRVRRNDHLAYPLLHSQPNYDMTAFEFRECLMISVLLSGNAYAFIEKRAERPIALWPLLPDRTRARRQNGQLVYDTVVNKQRVTLRPDQILHIPGLSFDGISGKSVIEQAANVFGIALAADRFGAKFFG